MKAAASNPAPSVAISRVKRYVARAVNPLNPGANKTQTLRISTGRFTSHKSLWMTAEVTMRPGYNVPPATRPSGYHDLESNQFQNDEKEVLTNIFDARKLNHLEIVSQEDKRELRIKFMDYGFETDDGEETGGNCCSCDCCKDQHFEKGLYIVRRLF